MMIQHRSAALYMTKQQQALVVQYDGAAHCDGLVLHLVAKSSDATGLRHFEKNNYSVNSDGHYLIL